MNPIVIFVIIGLFLQWIVGSPIQHYLEQERIVAPWVGWLIRIAIGVIGPSVLFLIPAIFGSPEPDPSLDAWINEVENWY